MSRRRRTSITKGGCHRCRDQWEGENAHMLAAKHHADSGHPTWSMTTGSVTHRYGGAAGADQPRLF